jgi:hypothetical protein
LPNASSALRPLLAAPAALLLSQEQAKAVLTYNFFESAGNVVVQTSGSLDLTGATPLPAGEGCGPAAFDSDVAVLCTGVKNNYDGYVISGPSALDGNGNSQFASSVSGINIRAPRIISKSQKFCRHKEAAKEAAEKKNAISTIEKIA